MRDHGVKSWLRWGSLTTTLSFISESPGPAVPDSTYTGRTYQLNMGVPWCARLHPALGEASAPYRATTKPPGLAVPAKRFQLGGGFRGHSA